MDIFKERADTNAKNALKLILQRAVELDDVLNKAFDGQDAMLSKIHEKFAEMNSREAIIEARSNQTIVNLVKLLQDELGWAVTQLWHIERWIVLNIPAHEDGNNFGVDVQQSVLKTVQERSALLAGFLQDLSGYFWARASLFDKISKVTVNKVTSSTTSSKSEESQSSKDSSTKKDKDGDKEEESSSNSNKSATASESKNNVVEERQTIHKDILDYQHYLACQDVKWWFTLRDCLRQVQDSYLMVADIVEKNKSKVEAPKGQNSGGSFMY